MHNDKPITTRSKSEKATKPAPVQKVPISTAFDKEIYYKIEDFRKRNGLPFPQDVVRLAVAAFFNREQ